MTRRDSGASSRLVLGAVLAACAWVVGFWMSPGPESRDDRVVFGPPPSPSEDHAGPAPSPGRDEPIIVDPSAPVGASDPGPEDGASPIVENPPEPVLENPADLPRVTPPKFDEYLTGEGERFETIAKKYYGDSRKWTVIARANPLLDPNRLRPGTVILIPKDPANIQGIENPVGFDTYTVGSGDTLSDISKKVYGKATLWGLIADANPGIDPDRLKVGTVLKIPKAP